MYHRILLLLIVDVILAHCVSRAQISFVPNQNQWDENVLYRAEIESGAAFFGAGKVTYAYYSTHDVVAAHDRSHEDADVESDQMPVDVIHCHSFEVNFVGAQSSAIIPGNVRNHSVNYFLGADPEKWASNVSVYGAITYPEIYPGIDALYYGEVNQLKYDFIVNAGSDASQIVLDYKGQRSIQLVQGSLLLDLGFTTIKEVIPSAYQWVNGIKQEVKCEFVLRGDRVSFRFPDGYDHHRTLIIDPAVIASTYSDGVGVTGGFSATYDEEGNIYTAGDAFSLGMPATLGAYCDTFCSVIDLVVSKYNPDGSNLIYCTYIGGSNYEFPQNLFAKQGRLYVYGSTLSWDFPVLQTAYDTTLSGNSDIYITCLDNTGSNLLGSTFVGGNWGEGTSMLTPFYPDKYRGEVRVANNGDVLVCSTTMSTTFPATAGAFRTSLVGGQDAVVFRMNESLTSMMWATFLGSGAHDVAWGIKEAADGSIYVCGGTNNMLGVFPTTPGCYQTTGMGGTDAFIVHLDANGTTLLASTLFGGVSIDAAYYIDLDKDGDVYICGYNRGAVPVTEGVYVCQNANNFVAKFNSTLTELMYSTTIGSSTPVPTMTMNGPPTPPGPPPLVGPEPIRANNNALTAFMVDECERVYIGAYVGAIRWALTDDAMYQYTADNQYCVLVLEEDALAMLTSTMYSGLHVDGGSGHFDENGVLYQASCVERNQQVFMTTPWAYADSTGAGIFDICVFKIDMHVDLIDSISYPNVFTPNNDGINDQFMLGEVTTNFYDMTVYDRNGTPLFHSTDVGAGWDGTYNGKECAEGVYYYAVRYHFCTELKEKGGFVHLSRGN